MYNLDEKWSRSALRDPLKYDGGTSGADECPGNLAAADCAATVNRLIAAAVRAGDCHPKVVAAFGAVFGKIQGYAEE